MQLLYLSNISSATIEQRFPDSTVRKLREHNTDAKVTLYGFSLLRMFETQEHYVCPDIFFRYEPVRGRNTKSVLIQIA